MLWGLVRPSGTLDHAQLLGDESVTAFKRPPRGGLGRLEESELKIRIHCLPAPPKSPPRHCSRDMSWSGRPNHQGEPHAPGLPPMAHTVHALSTECTEETQHSVQSAGRDHCTQCTVHNSAQNISVHSVHSAFDILHFV